MISLRDRPENTQQLCEIFNSFSNDIGDVVLNVKWRYASVGGNVGGGTA